MNSGKLLASSLLGGLLLPIACDVAHALTLSSAIDEAVRTHPTVQNQVTLREASEVDLRTARQQYWPTPSISIERVDGGGNTDLTYGSQATVQTYRLQQPLWTWGRLAASVERAEAGVQVATESVHDARQQIALRTVQVWSDWRLSKLRLQAQQQSVETHRRLLGVLQRRVDQGASPPSELSLTRSRLDQAVSQLQAHQTQQRINRFRLSQLTGRQIKESEEPEDQLIDLGGRKVDVLTDSALATSSALNKIRAQKNVLMQEVRERKADLAPEIFMRLERSDYRGGTTASGVPNNRVYFGLSSRFGAGLSNFTIVEGAQKRLSALDSEVEAVERNLLESVQSEVEQLDSLDARLPNIESALQASKETVEAWDRQFLAGRRSWVEVLNAAREMVQAEIDLSDARVARSAALWRLKIFAGDLHSMQLRVEKGRP